ncbi:SPOR domain-containing protein [uncultured Enterovirga sp.]|uniref:SPOR domain-containing protein n=1 Tax=uncultured Enterovirga sp. TaxID=2026352 RepID=UPI0035CBC7DE
MSEARHQRFEIDIEEIERELRRSAEAAPAPRTDPLAELARIVGQDDPFRGIIGEGRANAGAAPPLQHGGRHEEPGQGGFEPVLDAGDRFGARGTSPQQGGPYDPVQDVYGSPDAALSEEDMQPLRPRRSRARLAAVIATLVVATGAGAGGLYWYRTGGSFSVSGPPPLVSADRTPVKKPPENPGGMEVPNQDRQIYERGASDGTSRVVDGREQPIDVREAARGMPAVTDRPPTISARAPVAGAPVAPGSAPEGGPVPPTSTVAVAPPPPSSNAVASALGEPRRVRTVAVRPDGSVYTPSSTASLVDTPPSLMPGGTLPPPVAVSTVSVPGRNGSSTPALAAPAPAMAPPPASAALAAPNSPGDAAPAREPVRVLPPARPKSLVDAASTEAPTRTASVETADSPPRAGSDRRPASETAGNFTVQIAVRPTEAEARAAYTQLQERFSGDLDGRPATVTEAEVRGKTVHRVRVGPMTKASATALCTKLKSSGGSCFVAGN